MIIMADVLKKIDQLHGQQISVEGFISAQSVGREINSVLFPSPLGGAEHINLKFKPELNIEDYVYKSGDTDLHQLFIDTEFPSIKSEVAWDHYLAFLKDCDIKHLTPFIETGAMEFLTKVLATQNDWGKIGLPSNLLLAVSFSTSQESVSTFPRAQVTGWLDVLGHGEILLRDIQEIILYAQDFTIYIREGIQLDEVDFDMRDTIQLSQLYRDPEKYMNKIIKLDGLMIGREKGSISKSKLYLFIIPNSLYLMLKNTKPEAEGILIESDHFEEKLLGSIEESVGGQNRYANQVRIVGRLMPSLLSENKMRLLEISQCLLKIYDMIFVFKL